jgi:hypothetical protein
VDYGFGIHLEGRRAIKKFFIVIVGRRFKESMHQGHNPVIELEGNTARGRWLIYQYGVESRTGKAFRIGGKYEDEYEREEDGWKIKRIAKAAYTYGHGLDMEKLV